MADDTRKPEVDNDSETDDKSPLFSDSIGDSSASRSPSPAPIKNSPSPIRRLGLILFLTFLFWAAFKLHSSLIAAEKKPEVIYASWYSNEFKFRPAASPIITETLKDGRIRLRGAYPEPTSVIPQTQSHRKKKQNNKRKKRD